jgi:hypothetical protein
VVSSSSWGLEIIGSVDEMFVEGVSIMLEFLFYLRQSSSQSAIFPTKERQIATKHTARIKGIKGVACVKAVNIDLREANIVPRSRKIPHQDGLDAREISLPEHLTWWGHEHLFDPIGGIINSVGAPRNLLQVRIEHAEAETRRVVAEGPMHPIVEADRDATNYCQLRTSSISTGV